MSPAKSFTPRLTNAQRDLVAQWIPWIMKRAIEWGRRGGMRADEIDDMKQEAVLGAMRAATTYDPSKGAFPTWCLMSANQALTAASHARHMVRGSTKGSRYHLHAAGADPLDDMLAAEVDPSGNVDRERARTALSEFKPRERDQRGFEIFKRRAFADETKPPTLQAIANEIGCSREQVRILESRGREAFERFATEFRRADGVGE